MADLAAAVAVGGDNGWREAVEATAGGGGGP